jgi:hypothetical protein
LPHLLRHFMGLHDGLLSYRCVYRWADLGDDINVKRHFSI